MSSSSDREPGDIDGSGLLLISNRAPYSVQKRGRKTNIVRTVGGLASTLDDLLKTNKGTWLAWSGNTTQGSAEPAAMQRRAFSLTAPEGGYPLVLLDLTERQVAEYYQGFSNGLLWPLCHLFIGRSKYNETEWKTYEKVNRVFARIAARLLPKNGTAWVHDFQLALVPEMLRKERPDARIATFWHIPFPPDTVFRVNPRAREIVRGLLGSDLVGFHTPEYVRSFLTCAESLAGGHVDSITGDTRIGGRVVRAGAFPIGIESRSFAALAEDPKTLRKAEVIRKGSEAEIVLLAADRLDYTKGILERLEAYELFLEEHPEFHRRVCFIQIQVPSRENVPEYRELRERIDLAVGRITGRFSTAGWVPVRYLCRAYSRPDLVAYYRAADVMLVTPLRDGMNLVAQEYVAARSDGDGVLVFSEFAGAADRLREAVFANPYDRANLAAAIARALRIPKGERRRAMRAMRERVALEDVNWWLSEFLAATEECRTRAISTQTAVRRAPAKKK